MGNICAQKSITIGDNFKTIEEVQEALRRGGLEKSELIIGIDFTKSNTWQGKNTFGGASLHTLLGGNQMNQYQSVISILGQTLSSFDNDNEIPAFGFGDTKTEDHSVFPLKPNGTDCFGFEEVLGYYNSALKTIKLSGPTSFAPLINKAIEIVKEKSSYHILIIIADGCVDSIKETTDAIVAASHHPLSIIMVGVGDGPWDLMKEFDDKLPQRQFDNFQFVNYPAIMNQESYNSLKFAVQALMEIPEQYQTIKKLGLIKSKNINQLPAYENHYPLNPGILPNAPPGIPPHYYN